MYLLQGWSSPPDVPHNNCDLALGIRHMMADMDADKPDSMSSDEEGFVSSESTASMELESDAKRNLTFALGKLRLEQEDVNRFSDQGATPSTPPTEGRKQTPPGLKMPKKPRLLLDMPLDVLKEIIKEVNRLSRSFGRELTMSMNRSRIRMI